MNFEYKPLGELMTPQGMGDSGKHSRLVHEARCVIETFL